MIIITEPFIHTIDYYNKKLFGDISPLILILPMTYYKWISKNHSIYFLMLMLFKFFLEWHFAEYFSVSIILPGLQTHDINNLF